ncbi:M16 family metallopeptidase [Brenneria uluponensis]|uniref:M16 family metallopeptidase n=1 Tax=Brenneria uluponensis TaxID=3057057 RepID=UPI0028E9D0AD|nr:insulinase family protein [Brenneria ulupoensis]
MNDKSVSATSLVASIPEVAFQRFTLNNGLTLLVQEDQSTPMVAVHVTYGVGAKDEPVGMFGFAHLLEHLMFSGSAGLPGSYISHLELAGAQGLNGVTNADMTQFFQSVPVGSLDFALFAESDRMGHLLEGLQTEALNVQREVVTREMEENELQPYGTVQGVILRHLFPSDHPYAHKVAGERADLDQVSFEQVKSWVKRFYRPNNAVVTLVGAVTAQQALDKVNHWFGHIPPGEPLGFCNRWIPRLCYTRRVTLQDRVDSTLIRICWVIPPYGEESTTALELFSTVLTDTTQSLLVQRLMMDNNLASDVSSFIEPGILASYFNLRIMLLPGALPTEVERIVKQTITEIMAAGIDNDLLQHSQQYLLQTSLDKWGDNLSLAVELGKHEMFPTKAEGLRQRVEQALSMTTETVLAAVGEWLDDGNLVLTVEPYMAAPPDITSVLPRIPPAIEIAPMSKTVVSHRLMLSNGLRVICMPAMEESMLSASLIVNAGSMYDPPDLGGMAQLVAGLISVGKDEHTDFHQQIYQQGAGFETDVGMESIALRMQMPVQNAETVLGLLADTISCHELRSDLISTHREHYLQMLPERGVVQWALPAMTFPPKHPLRHPAFTEGCRQTLQQITSDDIQHFFRRYYRPKRSSLIVYSSLSSAQLESFLESTFARWHSIEIDSPSAVVPAVPISAGSLMLVDQPGTSVTTLSVFFVLPGRSSPEDAAVQLIYNLLAASFGSRINFSLREVYRLSYGVSALQQVFPGGRLLGFELTVAAGNILETVQAICKEMRELLDNRPLSISEMRSLIQGERLRLCRPIANDYEALCQQESLLRQGLTEHYWYDMQTSLSLLSVGEVDHVIQQYLRPEAGKWILQGDIADYCSELEQLLTLPAYLFPECPDTLYQ